MVIRVTFILCQVPNRAIPTNKVGQEVCEQLEKRGLVFRVAHAEWDGLFDDNGVRIMNLLSIISSVQSDVTEVSIGELGIE